jgi:cysteine-rich repeat protein
MHMMTKKCSLKFLAMVLLGFFVTLTSCTKTDEPCGNGVWQEGEDCDDGNNTDGDGCSKLCEAETDWICDFNGLCRQCGNGAKEGVEVCDDGNLNDGDGCSALCLIEEGFSCSGSTISVCDGVCGDGQALGNEPCDDGNALTGDGCTNACEVESGWACDASGCVEVCGDSTIVGTEVCDDGNTDAGDGCSATCTREANWVCTGETCTQCASRVVSTATPGTGSGGDSHVLGYTDGYINVASGYAPSSSATTPRHYRIYVPPKYNPATPAPLVIMLPGHRVDIDSLAQYTQLQRTADINNFILVYAEQEWRWGAFRWAWWTDWQWAVETTDTNPDLTFLSQLVTTVKTGWNVDTSRVFAVGHSRGASMALIAALELPEVFAGAVVQSGFTEFSYHQRIPREGQCPMPLVFIHGIQDPDVCIDCVPGGTCSVTGWDCGSGLLASDALVERLSGHGWGDDLLKYYRLNNVAHRWQPQLNQHWFDWLNLRPQGEQ